MGVVLDALIEYNTNHPNHSYIKEANHVIADIQDEMNDIVEGKLVSLLTADKEDENPNPLHPLLEST